MKAIERAKAHFAEQDVKVIEVAEWGEDDKPLKIYSKPLTLAETSKLYKMSKEDDLTMMAYVLIYKALDDNGDKLLVAKKFCKESSINSLLVFLSQPNPIHRVCGCQVFV